MNARKVIEDHFKMAKKEIVSALETRMVNLLETIKEIETEDLGPMTNLKKMLDTDLATTKRCITEGDLF